MALKLEATISQKQVLWKRFFPVLSISAIIVGIAFFNGSIFTSTDALADSGNNTISGRVYQDLDHDSTFDGSDFGLDGIMVYLYSDSDCDGNGEVLIDSTLSDSLGNYSFSAGYSNNTVYDSLLVMVSSSSDDCNQKSDGSMNLTEGDLHLGQRHVGIRFTSIGVPQGATVTEAYIKFISRNSRTDDTDVVIYAEDVDDASTYSNSSNNLTGRTKTSAFSNWALADWSSDQAYYSPELKNLVQEVVNRESWSSGNDLAFIIEYTNGHHDPKSYDYSTSQAPSIFVKYQVLSTDCFTIKIKETDIKSGVSLSPTKRTASFSDGSGTDNNNDFALYLDSSSVNILSGNVFADANENGVKDGGEAFIEAATIHLYSDDNCDSIINNSDAILQSVTVGADGSFTFNIDESGTNCYTLSFESSSIPVGSSLTGNSKLGFGFTSLGNLVEGISAGLWGGALPVEWAWFNAYRNDDGVLLKWATSMEENNSHFEVQKSLDAQEWTVIDEIMGTGNSTDINEYQYLDVNADRGTIYYRLKQVDFDGNSEYSKSVVVNDQNLPQVVKIYPLPANNSVTVASAYSGDMNVTITDMAGNELINQDVSGSYTFDTHDLPNGFYIVTSVGNGTNNVQKIVIQH
jgi:hypothetical protein